jgi:hypothetical protein
MHTAGRIEQQYQIERFHVEAEINDRLHSAFIKDAEVVFSQSRDNAAVQIDRFSVNPNQRNTRTKYNVILRECD